MYCWTSITGKHIFNCCAPGVFWRTTGTHRQKVALGTLERPIFEPFVGNRAEILSYLFQEMFTSKKTSHSFNTYIMIMYINITHHMQVLMFANMIFFYALLSKVFVFRLFHILRLDRRVNKWTCWIKKKHEKKNRMDSFSHKDLLVNSQFTNKRKTQIWNCYDHLFNTSSHDHSSHGQNKCNI